METKSVERNYRKLHQDRNYEQYVIILYVLVCELTFKITLRRNNIQYKKIVWGGFSKNPSNPLS